MIKLQNLFLLEIKRINKARTCFLLMYIFHNAVDDIELYHYLFYLKIYWKCILYISFLCICVIIFKEKHKKIDSVRLL